MIVFPNDPFSLSGSLAPAATTADDQRESGEQVGNLLDGAPLAVLGNRNYPGHRRRGRPGTFKDRERGLSCECSGARPTVNRRRRSEIGEVDPATNPDKEDAHVRS